MRTTKICPACQPPRVLPLSAFHCSKRRVSSYCKECHQRANNEARRTKGLRNPPPRSYLTRENFFSHVVIEKSARGCWLAKGRPVKFGYKTVSLDGKERLAHRLAWEIANGPIPAGLSVCHDCDNPPCINPEHLFLGTNLDNIEDMVRKRRHRFGEAALSAKLTEEQVLEMRRARAVGALLRELAQRYGIDPATVHYVVTCKTWRHVA